MVYVGEDTCRACHPLEARHWDGTVHAERFHARPQTELERHCDYLHGLVESNLDCYLDPNITERSPFHKFRSKLISYAEATTQYYTNLVNGLEEYRLSKE